MSQQYTKELLLEYMEQLLKEIQHAYTKLHLHMYIHNKFVDQPALYYIAKTYFDLTIDALDHDYIILISKIFERPGRSYGNILKLLGLIESNLHLFPAKDLQQHVKAHQEVFETDNIDRIRNLKTCRDQLYAHSDIKYFLDKDRPKLGENAPMVYGDLIDLLEIACDTIGYYSALLGGFTYSLDNGHLTRDVDMLFDALNMYHEKLSTGHRIIETKKEDEINVYTREK